ncbi:MAG: hypothetical protein ACR2H3_02585 [Acidimicrobiales bacterium]
MLRSMRSRPTLLVLLLGVALVSAACVSPDAPDVGVNKVEAKLVFGVKPPDEPTKSPGEEVNRLVAAPPDLTKSIDLSGIKPPPPFLPPDLTPSKPESDCPTAPSGAAARDAAPVNVSSKARNGVARWKRGGSVTINSDGQKAPLAGFESRIVRNAKKVNDSTYTFETVQPSLGNPNQFFVQYFQANTDKVNRDPTSGVGTVNSPAKVGEADRGLLLVKSEVRDRTDTIVPGSVFQPTTALLMLPLPITSQEQWESAAVDPKTGYSIVMNATVRTVRTIDACGELMIGWFVESTQRFSAASSQNPGSGEIRYDFMVATQYGGQIIQERFAPVEGDAFDLSFTQGQVDPDPLPKG